MSTKRVAIAIGGPLDGTIVVSEIPGFQWFKEPQFKWFDEPEIMPTHKPGEVVRYTPYSVEVAGIGATYWRADTISDDEFRAKAQSWLARAVRLNQEFNPVPR